MLRGISVAVRDHVEVPAFVEAAALQVVAWAQAAFTVRGHLLVSNTLSQARHLQFWSGLELSQPYFTAVSGQARRCRSAHGQQIPVEADVLAHELVQAVGDSASFLLLLHLAQSWCYAGHTVAASYFGHSLRRQARWPSLNTSQTHLVADLR